MDGAKSEREWVERQVALWKTRMRLDHWAVKVEMLPDNSESEGYDVHAEILADLRYTEAKLFVRPSFFKQTAAYKKITIVHELAHMRTEPLRYQLERMVAKRMLSVKDARDMIEDQTEQWAKTVYAAYSKDRRGYTL